MATSVEKGRYLAEYKSSMLTAAHIVPDNKAMYIEKLVLFCVNKDEFVFK